MVLMHIAHVLIILLEYQLLQDNVLFANHLVRLVQVKLFAQLVCMLVKIEIILLLVHVRMDTMKMNLITVWLVCKDVLYVIHLHTDVLYV